MTRDRFVVGARWLGMLRRSGKGASRAIWIADDASDKRYCTGHTTAERFNSPTLGVMSDPPRLDSFLGSAFDGEISKDFDAYFAGTSVDWPPTICQRPFRLTHTSVKRRGPLTYPLADPVRVEMPVTTATSW